ncbi:zinc-ribbon domain containing protein [Nitzschia inconspicua]|uniref:Zinc-ribbon domain containing protein n=1 Tax=Nitzschia inconspicua TaxID=303405 RepID=A0A9K3L7B2_9STRA|nr:zinc-ribbon domain containing protein [Nitzschia inconspicua]
MPLAAPEDNYACRIIRSDRPCLVCPGQMDLVEAHPRYSLFSGLPLCTSETIDCLDCPKCGFSTSTTDYEYLQICKIQRQGMFQSNHSSRRERKGSRKERVCTNCHASLSSKWQFCPGCGSKCGASISKKTSFKVPAVVMGREHTTPTVNEEPTANVPSDASSSTGYNGGSSLDSQDTGILRMVTPPKRLPSTTDMNMEMINESQATI